MKTHGQDIWACDFLPVVTLFFQTLYAFVIVHVGSRRVVHINATVRPTDEWVAQQLREATPFGDRAKHLICDNDTKFGPVFEAAAKTCGLEVIHTPFEAPRANAICERFVGSVRRECLDHMLVFGSRQLVRVLVEYAGYFNPSRPHQGLARVMTETSRPVAPVSWSPGLVALTPALLGQSLMWPRLIEVPRILLQHTYELTVTQHKPVIETLAP